MADKMKINKEVLIFLPLPAQLSWRGEGIAQVVEKTVANTKGVNWTIMSNKSIIEEASQSLRSVQNVNFTTFGKSKKPNSNNKTSQKIEVEFADFAKTNKSALVLSRFLFATKFHRLWDFVSWLAKFYLANFQEKRSNYASYDYVWVPTPIVLVSKKIPKTKLIFSFWDPFVFEYSSFPDITKHYLFYSFSKKFLNCAGIITQSKANLDYLENILGMDPSKISVLPLAAGDVSDLVSDEMYGARAQNKLVKYWPERKYEIYKTKVKKPVEKVNTLSWKMRNTVMSKYMQELKNKSEIWRLEKRLGNGSKVCVISTQNRPHKGLHNMFQIIDKLTKLNTNLYFVFTGDVSSYLKKFPQLHENVIQLSRITNEQLAYLYVVSDIAIHPSFVEGGLGTGPQFEASSVGTPCLVNYGRHIKEAEEYFEVSFTNIYANFVDNDETVNKILAILTDDKLAQENINHLRQHQISWISYGEKFNHILNNA
ncbi:glycosyltransferase [Alphaproteobacteria bacterium]|nr:glycosyltransferase [Alphaproteobacteria bacterium]